jgi:hypothetical protein
MRFKVPQFIDIEDKIFGPLTFKQFMYLAGGAGLSYIFYKFLPIFLAIPLIVIFVGLAVSLTFVQINKKPFIFILEAYIRYIADSKMFIWKKTAKKRKVSTITDKEGKDVAHKTQKLTQNRLRDLSWGLNVIVEE